MTKAEQFRQAIKKLESDEQYLEDSAYMSDMSHWCIVHATKYLPRVAKDGSRYIPSTAMATGFEIPRTTIHVALNHVVSGHIGGNWDDTPIVVLAPYNDVTEKNGNPTEVAGTDTYWSVSPDTGFILPETAYVVQPDNNGPLFEIGEHGATYKRDNYTDEEVETILSMLSYEQKSEYDNYASGDLKTWQIEKEFYVDKRVKKMYESAKDKKAFLRGLFEESRFGILSKYLRDAVVKMSMSKLNTMWVKAYDADEVSKAIADTARSYGIDSTASNKGHSDSMYAYMEESFLNVDSILHGTGYGDDDGILTTDIPALYNKLFLSQGNHPLISEIILNLVENKPVDFAQVYQDGYSQTIKSWISSSEIKIDFANKEINEYIPSYDVDDERKQELISENRNKISVLSEHVKELSAKKTIGDYDKNLAETIRRHCERLSAEYNAWREKLEKQPGFEKLVQNLRALDAASTMLHIGRDEY